MTFSLIQVSLICLVYLSLLFGVAYATEQGWLPDNIIYHPITYVFSLGIFASAWSYYGVIELAENYGYGALAYYLGTGALFLFAPVALKPLFELARRFQINSIADLLTFRYHSQSVGGIVSICMLLSMAPLIALQIKAVADTAGIMKQFNDIEAQANNLKFGSREIIALAYCILVALFAMQFGAKREVHKGLISVMAFESIVKLLGLITIGLAAVYAVFNGPAGLDNWLIENPEHMANLYRPIDDGSSHTLLLVFLATAVSMPHIFHMTVVENRAKDVSQIVSWAFPLFLFFMALPIFPILWAGYKLGVSSPAEYFPLAIPLSLDSPTLAIISFVAGMSAATGAVVGIALAMATMIMNHWILPSAPLGIQKELYPQLVKIRRIVILVVVLAGYAFYWALKNRFNLTDLAFTSFIATLQFLPGVIAVAHWSRGNRKGLMAGLSLGMLTWFMGLFLPMLIGISSLPINLNMPGTSLSFNIGVDHWDTITLWSLGLNTITFVFVSLITEQTDDERYSAELCSEDELSHPIRLTLNVRSPEEIVERLSKRIGESTARIEVDRALTHLGLSPSERRPYALRRIRDELEANLSGLLGISMASEIMDRQVPFIVPESDVPTDITLIESRLNQYRSHLTGLAAELNNLRLYHRRTLEELPMAVCSVGKDSEILMWNSAMMKLTGISSEMVTGSHLNDVLEPWGTILSNFASSEKTRFYKLSLELADKTHWISLHKANIPTSIANKIDGQVILVEDITELQTLEKELIHSERLASVGRLAAGVAHEIGNPVTGIACLAQNMKYETDNEEVLETADQILSQTDRVTSIVQSLVGFSHSGSHENQAMQVVNLNECAEEAIKLLRLQKEKQQVTYENNLDESFNILGDSRRVIQIFVNLLSNSRDASIEGDKIVINGSEREATIEFHVTDQGAGIPPNIQDRILEPFFTTKDPGEGTGLGLAMVYSIVEEHKGNLQIISPCDKQSQNGTRIVINIPKAIETQLTKGNTTT